MGRFIGFGFLGAIVGAIAGGGSSYVIALGFLAGIALVAVPLYAGVSVLSCPYCHKRVKNGASVCHHCGREVLKV